MWMKDVGFIREKENLPITAVYYGPMLLEGEQARIKVGPLTCLPATQEDPFDVKVSQIGIFKMFIPLWVSEFLKINSSLKLKILKTQQI